MVKGMKLDEFKKFVKANPHLIKYVTDKKMTWQQFYEIYDLYGKDDNIWNDFKDNSSSDNNIMNTIKNIVNLAKGIDLNSIRKALTTLDRAIETFKGLNDDNDNNSYEERPKNKYFED